MTTITLNDGNKIPAVGFGVFLIPADGPIYDAVRTALDARYRHIDTAAAYFNEADVGRAVRDSGIPRGVPNNFILLKDRMPYVFVKKV